jgi:cysteinyl-tRNA synthetase
MQTGESNVVKTDAIFQLWHDARFLGFDLGSFRKQYDTRQQIDALLYARVSTLIAARNGARKAKNFKEADRIRDELKAMGIELEDHKDGTTTWKVKR